MPIRLQGLAGLIQLVAAQIDISQQAQFRHGLFDHATIDIDIGRVARERVGPGGHAHHLVEYAQGIIGLAFVCDSDVPGRYTRAKRSVDIALPGRDFRQRRGNLVLVGGLLFDLAQDSLHLLLFADASIGFCQQERDFDFGGRVFLALLAWTGSPDAGSIELRGAAYTPGTPAQVAELPLPACPGPAGTAPHYSAPSPRTELSRIAI